MIKIPFQKLIEDILGFYIYEIYFTEVDNNRVIYKFSKATEPYTQNIRDLSLILHLSYNSVDKQQLTNFLNQIFTRLDELSY